MTALADNLKPHLGCLLSSNAALAGPTGASIAKELNSAKVSTRRALSNGVGAAIWSVQANGKNFSPEGEKLLSTLASAFEANLNTATANAPSNPTGFLEGYVAAALALGPLSGVIGIEKIVKASALSNLLVVTPKPSFLLNDKAYGKLPTDMDKEWFLRALEAVVLKQSSQFKNEQLRYVL